MMSGVWTTVVASSPAWMIASSVFTGGELLKARQSASTMIGSTMAPTVVVPATAMVEPLPIAPMDSSTSLARSLPVAAVPELCSLTFSFRESIAVSLSSSAFGTKLSLRRSAHLYASSDDGLGSTAAEICVHDWTYVINMRMRSSVCDYGSKCHLISVPTLRDRLLHMAAQQEKSQSSTVSGHRLCEKNSPIAMR